MTTKLKMFNKTLIKLGCETITAITDESKPVRLIDEIYDDIVKEELQKHNWIFAKKKAVLFANDILSTVENVADVTVDDVVLSADKNVLTITAASVGVSGNDIVIKSTNKSMGKGVNLKLQWKIKSYGGKGNKIIVTWSDSVVNSMNTTIIM